MHRGDPKGHECSTPQNRSFGIAPGNSTGSTVEENVISVNRYILLSSILDDKLNQADGNE
jgi:hypothetical protein